MPEHRKATLAALFEDADHARKAIDALNGRGMEDNRISVVTSAEEVRPGLAARDEDLREAGLGPDEVRRALQQAPEDAERMDDLSDRQALSGAAAGAAAGAATAGTATALLALGVASQVIPPLGLAVGGPILAVLAATGAGAVGGSIVGAIVGEGLPDPDAHHFLSAVMKGKSLVLVRTDSDHYAEDRAALAEAGGYDIQLRGPHTDAQGEIEDPARGGAEQIL